MPLLYNGKAPKHAVFDTDNNVGTIIYNGTVVWTAAPSVTYWAKPQLESGYIYIRKEPRQNAATNGSINAGVWVQLVDNTPIPGIAGDPNQWYQLMDGRGYVRKDQVTVEERPAVREG